MLTNTKKRRKKREMGSGQPFKTFFKQEQCVIQEEVLRLCQKPGHTLITILKFIHSAYHAKMKTAQNHSKSYNH